MQELAPSAVITCLLELSISLVCLHVIPWGFRNCVRLILIPSGGSLSVYALYFCGIHKFPGIAMKIHLNEEPEVLEFIAREMGGTVENIYNPQVGRV